MNMQVDRYIQNHPEWQPQLQDLRTILLEMKLDETIKWGGPCYVVAGKNVVGLAAFKQHIALWFHQGVFLKDDKQVLINAQEGTTKAMRQWRFASEDKIPEKDVKAYIKEAMANAQAGNVIKPDRDKPIVIVSELRRTLAENKDLGTAFENLSRAKQREYADHVSSAKREETRIKRLLKITPLILNGKGLNDQYR